jgi:Ca2+-transporting ATPase
MSDPQLTTANPAAQAWHTQSANQVLKHLDSSNVGLSSEDAAKRLAADGPNALAGRERLVSDRPAARSGR